MASMIVAVAQAGYSQHKAATGPVSRYLGHMAARDDRAIGAANGGLGFNQMQQAHRRPGSAPRAHLQHECASNSFVPLPDWPPLQRIGRDSHHKGWLEAGVTA